MLPNDYCHYAELVAAIPNDVGQSQWEAGHLSVLINRVSRNIDTHFGRPPGFFNVTADSVRYFKGDGTRWLHIDPICAITEVAQDERGDRVTYTVKTNGVDYDPYPLNAIDTDHPYTALYIDPLLTRTQPFWYPWPKAVKITGKWGWATATPPDIKQACITQCIRHMRRLNQGMSDVGGIIELGQLQYVNALDPEVALLLNAPGYKEVPAI